MKAFMTKAKQELVFLNIIYSFAENTIKHAVFPLIKYRWLGGYLS